MQMVDKIWYDWQRKSPKNKYAYGGGSVEATDVPSFAEFPTGLPPYYGVSTWSDPNTLRDNDIGWTLFPSLSLTVRSLATACGTVFEFGTRWTPREILYATSMLRY